MISLTENGDNAENNGRVSYIYRTFEIFMSHSSIHEICMNSFAGAFLVPYVIMLLLVGLPLFFMELAFGQFASLGPITIWRINPLFKGT